MTSIEAELTVRWGCSQTLRARMHGPHRRRLTPGGDWAQENKRAESDGSGLERFKFILALASGGSVVGAARRLGVDSSTVSRRLAALEESVGAQLIVRGGQKFAWTTEGRAILGAAQTIQATVSEATRAVQSTKLGTSAVVRVSCPPGLSAALNRLMVVVRELRPDLTLELCGEDRAVDLGKGEADLAIRMFRPTEPDLVCRQSFEAGWCVYASQSYLSAHGTPGRWTSSRVTGSCVT